MLSDVNFNIFVFVLLPVRSSRLNGDLHPKLHYEDRLNADWQPNKNPLTNEPDNDSTFPLVGFCCSLKFKHNMNVLLYLHPQKCLNSAACRKKSESGRHSPCTLP